MKLMTVAFKKAEELEDETLLVSGVASTESIDAQGEIIKAAAVQAALPEFMRYPALRYMHSSEAVGKVTKAIVHRGVTAIEALVVDREAVRKVKHGVLRAFSLGGKVLARDSKNSKIITKLSLSEISIVDSPANRDSVLEIVKFVKPAGSASKQNPTADQIKAAMARLSPEEYLEIVTKAAMKMGRGVSTRDWNSTPGLKR